MLGLQHLWAVDAPVNGPDFRAQVDKYHLSCPSTGAFILLMGYWTKRLGSGGTV